MFICKIRYKRQECKHLLLYSFSAVLANTLLKESLDDTNIKEFLAQLHVLLNRNIQVIVSIQNLLHWM